MGFHHISCQSVPASDARLSTLWTPSSITIVSWPREVILSQYGREKQLTFQTLLSYQMDGFRAIIIDVFLSSRVSDYSKIQEEGSVRMRKCNHFNGKSCNLVLTEDSLLCSWREGESVSPHPVLCYLCPFYSTNREGKTKVGLLELLGYYTTIKRNLERELIHIESKIGETLYSSIALKRRREELINIMDQTDRRISLIKTLMRLEGES
jgi:hypothetical protein